MDTSPYEWKILELDEKPQTNKNYGSPSFLIVSGNLPIY